MDKKENAALSDAKAPKPKGDIDDLIFDIYHTKVLSEK